eukprot:TRINITY_DN19026_c0_g1_i1.p1 TRINITY_DN19026_c0_g1~~TRINITY_DN19026_c0_g1_i1.p1  ORF type:complete len:294 (+),score=65.85 TRINITY_DN19026_c0_g1_i1:53-934(+)
MSIKKVGWIGTGIMGRWMAHHLMKGGIELEVCTRTPSKAAPLLKMGATWAKSPSEMGDRCDAVISMVGTPCDVEEVILGEDGALQSMSKGKLLIDMSTSDPGLAVTIYNEAKQQGVGSIDAPVSGGDVGAKNAALSIFCGGDDIDIKRAMPLFDLMGTNITVAGAAGSGQSTKVVNQILIASTIIGVCESLFYAERAGLNLHNTIKAIGTGAAGGFQINNLGPRIVDGDLEPGFSIEHFLKDLQIAIGECIRHDITLPGLEHAKDLYEDMVSDGYSKKGTHALILAIRRINSE